MIFLAGFLVGIAFSLIFGWLTDYAQSRAYQDRATGGDRPDPQRAGSSFTCAEPQSINIEIEIEEWVNGENWVNRQGGW